MTEIPTNPGPLDGVRVIDLTTWLGAYTGRLLTDLGAEVIRVEPDGGVPERQRPPLTADGMSLSFVFTEVGKTSVSESEVDLDELLGTGQILLTSEGPAALRAKGLHPDDVTRRHPSLVHVSISPYGLTGPHADRPASDLTLLAAGGLLSLAGDPDREPVRPWGSQSAVVGGVHAAAATLIALLALETSGRGQTVDVSVQEAVAHSLENAVQSLDLEGLVRKRAGAGPMEAGTGLFRCANGWVYLVGGLGGRPLAWPAIVDWLEEGGIGEAAKLREDRWQQAEWRRSTEARADFRTIFERFALNRTKEDLYQTGQRRGISIAPVSTPDDLLNSPQLNAQSYFRRITVGTVELMLPGPPYRFSHANVGPGAGLPERATSSVLHHERITA
ncbi:CoA transferase [Amycolatopsis sp. NPDC051372]|uniref:CoA transferase n=1 Tax=Amycolatopsis sp. NPDC051372 TaxID=3155669 RepID=UPI00342D8DD6